MWSAGQACLLGDDVLYGAAICPEFLKAFHQLGDVMGPGRACQLLLHSYQIVQLLLGFLIHCKTFDGNRLEAGSPAPRCIARLTLPNPALQAASEPAQA